MFPFRVSLFKLVAAMAESKSEKRARQRVPVRLPLSIKVENSQVQGTAHTRDLNSGGMFFYTDQKIREGTELEIVVVLPGELTFGEGRWVCCQASVVRVEKVSAEGNLGIAAKIHRYQILPEI